ncbi:helix-turn-helix domain-containing protein [Coprobacter tertius]|uniref:AraC family transcriptional regulator n=1 Tax=Coprobacter tertius TaxID=2944915 RepID=A0ABT1MJH4_9BACT|nr:AraC family transcriptional regulator [Coprobacter tertius]MCP9612026.1 AraC family transcriptional regulator [Coprobacter tertius]
MEENLPKFDIPENFIVGDDISGDILNLYGKFPCKIKSGIFVLCMQGSIKARINLSEYEVKPYDFVTLPPESFIQIRETSSDVHLYFAAFSSHFIDRINFIKTTADFLPVITENPVLSLTKEAASLCEDFFSLMIKSHAYSDSIGIKNMEITRSVLNLIIQLTTEIYKKHTEWKQTSATRENEIYKEFIQMAMTHYMKEHSVSYYASQLGITLQHFCSTIKKVTGKTASEIIMIIIIMDAKAQLKSTNLPIKKIAYSLGFTNQAFFNKYFKQHVGMTPKEYRNS